MKVCSNCSKSKKLIDFTKSKTTKDLLNGTCRDCHRHMTQMYWKSNPLRLKEKKFREKLRARYGITPEDLKNMLAAQKHICANPGCLSPIGRNKNTHIDHDHATGEIRGVLCRSCNVALGFLKDSSVRICGLNLYLTKGGI